MPPSVFPCLESTPRDFADHAGVVEADLGFSIPTAAGTDSRGATKTRIHALPRNREPGRGEVDEFTRNW
jgi:hypothetical protein